MEIDRFIAEALGRLLDACGHPAAPARRTELREAASVASRVENAVLCRARLRTRSSVCT